MPKKRKLTDRVRASIAKSKVAYPDLKDEDQVFMGLLGYGMFADKLPPCFTSENLLRYAFKHPYKKKAPSNHAYIEYRASRNIDVPRQMGIPHPESYLGLCSCIKKYWREINKHSGKPRRKISYCHVQYIKGKNHIFDMNYPRAEAPRKEEKTLDYALGCRFVVVADIAACYPGIYTHSIPWSTKDKTWAKANRFPSWDSRVKKLSAAEKTGLWPNDLDAFSRSIKDNETNGILIGPHTSNIISEIILTAVDSCLLEKKFRKVIRNIDDYVFFAKNEEEAKKFLRTLDLKLKDFELALNAKKTKIVPFEEYEESSWIRKLNQFYLPEKDKISYSLANSYIDHAIELSKSEKNFAALKYAVKVLSQRNQLTDRAKQLYIKRILQCSLEHPYLVPLLEEHVFIFAGDDLDFLEDYLPLLIDRALIEGTTDALSFAFYFASKYEIPIKVSKKQFESIIDFEDCVSMTLAYLYANKYCEKAIVALFKKKAKYINSLTERDKDKFWLFLYEVFLSKDLSGYLQRLKKAGVKFIDYSKKV